MIATSVPIITTTDRQRDVPQHVKHMSVYGVGDRVEGLDD